MDETVTEELTDNKEYEERADFIDDDDLKNWTTESDFLHNIQNKILQRGAKLIVGPRGTGKTHQFRLAYNKCLKDEKMPMAVYVTYGKYYHLEPFLTRSSRAIKIFHTWVLGKILLGCYNLLSEIESKSELFKEDDAIDKKRLESFVSQAEKSYLDDFQDELITRLTIHKVISTLESLALKLNKKRIILLLDDAALSLTPDYMVEFFDIFRSLKTKKIAPKASVYPGTTEYGPRFHIGHDAEEVNAWPNVEEKDYSTFMEGLLQKRFHEVIKEVPKDIIELLKFASFGVPRTFIGLLRDYIQNEGKTMQQKFNNVVHAQAKLIEKGYFSLIQKIPQYRMIINTGFVLFKKAIEIITEENKTLQNEKQIQVGILRERHLKFDRMVKLLIEAGLLYELEPVRHGGSEREYNRYILHLLFLLKNRTFSSDRGFNPQNIVAFINRKSSKHPIRRSFDTILSREQIENIRLDLPPCNYCKTPRLTEDQKFCHSCGHQLVEQSTFEKCMNLPIDNLPISERLKRRIKVQTRVETIGDLLNLPAPARALQKADYIGPKRSEMIYRKAKSLAEEFLA